MICPASPGTVPDTDRRAETTVLGAALRLRNQCVAVLHALDAVGKTAGLSATQMFALQVLAERGECTIVELARELRHDAGAATRMLVSMEAKDLILRRRTPDNRRVVLVDMTPAGRTALARFALLLARGGQPARRSAHGRAEPCGSPVDQPPRSKI